MDLANKYFEAKDDLNEHTRKAMINYIKKAAVGFATKPCDSITRRDLQTLRDNLKGVKASTRNKAQTYLSAIMNWGVEQELIIRNPWAGARKLKEQPFSTAAKAEDFKKIRQKAASHLAWAIDVSLSLALRPGYVELLSLRWECFNWDHGYVEMKQGKGGGLKRVYPPEAFMARAKKRFAVDQTKGIPWVVHYGGRQIQSLKTAWKNAKRRAGYQGHPIRLYDIRHVAASEMLARGSDPAAVQHQLGHKRLSTTLDVYSHVLQGAQRRAAELIPGRLETEDEDDIYNW